MVSFTYIIYHIAINRSSCHDLASRYYFQVALASELQDVWCEEIWNIFEHNMKQLYVLEDDISYRRLNTIYRAIGMNHLASVGILKKRRKKCSTLFLASSLFAQRANIQHQKVFSLTAYSDLKGRMTEISSTGDSYHCIFAINKRTHLRSYEMQIRASAQRNGLGRSLVSGLEAIGRGVKMTGIMLTVFTGQ